MNIFNWLRVKLGIKSFEEKIEHKIQCHIENQDKLLREKIDKLDKLTKVDVDLGFRGNNTVILTGVYNKKGYVQFYDIPQDDFKYLVEMMRDWKKHNLIRNIDSPYPRSGWFDLI